MGRISALYYWGEDILRRRERRIGRDSLFLSLSSIYLSLLNSHVVDLILLLFSLYLSVNDSPTDLTHIILCYTLLSSSILYIFHYLSYFYYITSFLFNSFFFLFLSLFPSFPVFSLSIYIYTSVLVQWQRQQQQRHGQCNDGGVRKRPPPRDGGAGRADTDGDRDYLEWTKQNPPRAMTDKNTALYCLITFWYLSYMAYIRLPPTARKVNGFIHLKTWKSNIWLKMAQWLSLSCDNQ